MTATTAIKERPILMNGEMVRAVLSGLKTQTRRMMKPQPAAFWNDGRQPVNLPYDRDNDKVIRCPYGKSCDRLWVREKFAIVPHPGSIDRPRLKIGPDGQGITWQADWQGNPSGFKWKPSIHMPRWASRITLEITGVRVERLNQISRGDAMAEGCPFPNMQKGPDPRKWYSDLWEQINGPGSWEADPWVWVIDFVVTK